MLDELADIDAGREEASRPDLEREARSKRARDGAAKRKSAGLPLGNTRNLHEAQLLGAAVVKRTAQCNFDKFDELEAAAIREGATTGPGIAAWLNNRGHRAPSGGLWTKGNDYQTRRKSRARKASVTAPVTAPPHTPPKPPIVDAGRRITLEGKERLKTAMKAKGYKWGRYANLMEELGESRYNASIGYADKQGSPLNSALSESLLTWVEKIEAEKGL